MDVIHLTISTEHEEILARPPEQTVTSRAVNYDVIAGAAVKQIIPSATEYEVISRSAREGIGARSSGERGRKWPCGDKNPRDAGSLAGSIDPEAVPPRLQEQ